jgi:ABC-type transporter Mla MlaB component
MDRLNWKIVDGDVTKVALQGPIDEDANFAPLIEQLDQRGKVRFDLSGIARINSCGVREWVNFIRALPKSCNIELEKCTPAVVSQLNMISNFAGTARVLSVHAPFVCDACGREEDVLVDVESGQTPSVGEIQCGSCGGKMEFDDVESSYFAFLD